MKQLYYATRQLLHSGGGSTIKLLSLTLGLLVGVLLFSRIAYEFSYEKCYPDPDRLVLLRYQQQREGDAPSDEYDISTFRPAAGDLRQAMPDLVESSTVVMQAMAPTMSQGDKKLEGIEALYADTLFFQTMGIDVLQGKPQELATPRNAFISDKLARQLFGDESPIGKVLRESMENKDVTIRGVYKDVPGNTMFPHNMVLSVEVANVWFGNDWTRNDIFMSIFRLKHKEDVQAMNDRMQKAVQQYRDTEVNGTKLLFNVIPLPDVYFSMPGTVQRTVVMAVLGFLVFFVSIMNYVLVTVASFGRRAKAVGVHKCSGAGGESILSMFLWETGIIVLAGILLCLLLLYNLQDPIEDLLNLSFKEMFTRQNLWVSGVTIVLLFLIAGLLPGRMFARIPVTQIFRRYTDGKRGWKQSLLFIEFVGVSFIMGVLLVAFHQYQSLLNSDYGIHSDDRLAIGFVSPQDNNVRAIGDELRRQPFVVDVSHSNGRVLAHYSTIQLNNVNGINIGSMHWMLCDKEYPPMMGMTLLEGHWPHQPGDIVVSESVEKNLGWTDGAVGKKLPIDDGDLTGTIVGVIKNVRNMSFMQGETMVAYVVSNPEVERGYTVNVLLKEPFADNLRRLNEHVHTSHPNADIQFMSIRMILQDGYQDTARFRNTVLITSVGILLIVLIGLIGYVNDETQRRSKEIAIRKVNGAEVSGILRLFAWDVIKVASIAIVLGTVGAYYVAGLWTQQFVDVAPVGVMSFVAVGLVALALIVACVVLKAYSIANENPVKSIKAE